MKILFRPGRQLFGGLFVYNGVNHVRNYAARRGAAAMGAELEEACKA